MRPRHTTAIGLAALKALLVLSLVLVVVDPGWGNLEGKAPVARALVYPLPAFAVPIWWWWRRPARPYPVSADLLLTLVCFSDILGNRLDLYDTVVWFDDAIHLLNGALLAGAVLLLGPPAGAGLASAIERAVAVGLSAALAWELFEYVSFVTRSAEYAGAYQDTIVDLTLGWVGAVLAAVVFHRARRGSSRAPGPGTGGWSARPAEARAAPATRAVHDDS